MTKRVTAITGDITIDGRPVSEAAKKRVHERLKKVLEEELAQEHRTLGHEGCIEAAIIASNQGRSTTANLAAQMLRAMMLFRRQG